MVKSKLLVFQVDASPEKFVVVLKKFKAITGINENGNRFNIA